MRETTVVRSDSTIGYLMGLDEEEARADADERFRYRCRYTGGGRAGIWRSTGAEESVYSLLAGMCTSMQICLIIIHAVADIQILQWQSETLGISALDDRFTP